jgi:XisI protein
MKFIVAYLKNYNQNANVCIKYDGTSQPVAEALLEAGILREDIVLGCHPAELRQYTDFAVS